MATLNNQRVGIVAYGHGKGHQKISKTEISRGSNRAGACLSPWEEYLAKVGGRIPFLNHPLVTSSKRGLDNSDIPAPHGKNILIV